MKKILFILISLFGCSATETIITDKKIEITVPAIKDTLKAEYKEIPKVFADSLQNIFKQLPDSARIEAVKDIEVKSAAGGKSMSKIKNVRVKYFPKKNFFELDIPEHKIDTTFRDTTKFVIKKETTFVEKIGYGTIGIILLLIIIAVFFFAVKK